MPIFVDTDNSQASNKLFNGMKAGSAAGKAEAKMQAAVKRIIDKAPGFTTAKFDNAKGYAIRLTISKLDIGNGKTSCSLSGSIVRYPATVTLKGAKGDEMVSTSMTGNGNSTGTSEGDMLAVVEAIAEDLTTKSIPIMKNDMTKR
jgi:hypothetical protein